MRKLLLIPPIAAVVITLLVVYRLNRPEPVRTQELSPVVTARPLPLFQLYDEQSQLVRVQRYVGRHKLLIVFFDGTRGPDQSELLLSLKKGFRPVYDTGAVALAIGALRPSELRPAPNDRGERIERAEPFPFSLLADFPVPEVHRQLGAWDEASDEPREAVVIVDRAGIIRIVHTAESGLGTPGEWAAELRSIR